MGTSLEEAFKHFDSDKSGTISAQELLQSLKGLGQFHDIITLQDAQRFVQGFTSAVSARPTSSSDTTKRGGATAGMSKQAFFEFVRYEPHIYTSAYDSVVHAARSTVKNCVLTCTACAEFVSNQSGVLV
jgi:EF hand